MDLKWYSQVGLGPTYTTKAHGPKVRSPKNEKACPSKRAATLVELSPRKKHTIAEGDSKASSPNFPSAEA